MSESYPAGLVQIPDAYFDWQLFRLLCNWFGNSKTPQSPGLNRWMAANGYPTH